MFNAIYLDANVLMDFIDDRREGHLNAKKIVISQLEKNRKFFTSCDIITTIYYLSAKYNKKEALKQIENINNFCSIVDFSNSEIASVCALMNSNKNFVDLEDTLQYILAKKSGCELIISNDKKFFSPDITLMRSDEFCDKYGASYEDR